MNGIDPITYTTITRSGEEMTHAAIIHETRVCIFVNGIELVSMMASPVGLDALAVGFLANEGFITDMDAVDSISLRDNQTCVDVWLTHEIDRERKATYTSGCGKGMSFEDEQVEFTPITSDRQLTPAQCWAAMDQLSQSAALYAAARGVHTSAISNGDDLVLVAEDIGRHNTLDKLHGLALLQGVDVSDMILLATGRISSEMIRKARHLHLPIVCSRTSPTSLSVSLAEQWGITLVGYLRRNSMNLYTHPQRIVRP